MRRFRDMNCSRFLRTPKNKRSLKAQLFSSFGLAAFASLFLVVISSCFVVSNSGQKLIDRSQDLMVKQVENRLVSSSELFAMAGRGQFVEESLQILVESVRDRFAGYPTMEGWETGKYVPFETADTTEGPDGKRMKQRRYPLNQPPVPLDWQITTDIDVDGIDSPFLEPKLKEYPTAISSTKTAHYRIPGIFYNEASAHPMNVTTELLKSDGIYQSTGDLSVFLKSIYESIPELLTIEINFFNGGAGTTLQYPATATDDKRFSDTYVTAGCEWMTLEKNPYTGKPYASEAKCPPPGTVVPSRLHNPMEKRAVKGVVVHASRQFEYALNRKKTTHSSRGIDNTTSFVPPNNFQKSHRDQVHDPLVNWEGPLKSNKDNNITVLTGSKAIYDRITSEFIGVVTVEILETALGNDLRRRTLDDDSDVYMVYHGDSPAAGIIIGSTPGAEEKVFERLSEYDEIASAFEKVYEDYLLEWKRFKSSPPNTIAIPQLISSTYFTKTSNNGFLVAVPTPSVPYFPCDNYAPRAFVVQKIPPSIFGEFYVFADRVSDDVKKNIILCILLGVVGLVLVLSILAMMSNILTQPLTWITIVARKMGNNQKSDMFPSTEYFSRSKTESIVLEDDVPGMNLDPEVANNYKVGVVNFDYHPEADANAWCTLSTELQQLLEAFQSMIHGFSGDGVSEVAEPGLCEIQNSLTWRSDFSKLYGGSIEEGSFKKLSSKRSKRQASEATTATTVGSVEGENSFRTLSSNMPVSDWTPISTVGSIKNNSNNSRVVTDASYHQNPSNEMSDTYCVSPKSNYRDSSHNSRTSLHAAPLESMDEIFQRASTPQDQPAFLSSAIQDQDSSEECLLSQQQDTPASRFKYDNRIMLPGPPPRTLQMIVPTPIKVNWTSTLGAPKFDPKQLLQKREKPFQKIKTACCSKLFWWIVVLMALPILVTNGIIGAIVSTSILVTLPKTWIESAKQGSNDIELDAMQLFADRKAAILSNMMQGPVRDVYLMTRISNWIVFGGIQRSNTSTILDSTSENCKGFPEGECPFSSPCSCDWNVGWNVTSGKCDLDGSIIDSRYLQQQWFEVQKTDSDTVTGNRQSSPSFPTSLNSPESTLWWKNISDLPGSEVGPNDASGYKTLYDRVVVSSASAVFNFPIYNYPSNAFKERYSFGGYLAFADDGLLVGWSGCDNWHSSASNFVSTFENGASLIDEDLCANGKYGYDPRCRSWYTQGRERYLHEDIPYHVTPLYKNALSDQIAQTITSPIANPKTGEYVGQVALDFKVDFDSIAKMLDEESSISFMITPHEDILGGDTVVSPGSEKGWASAKIEDLLFTNEPNNVNSDYFKQEVLPLMKAGERGDTKFSITNEDGLEDEICLYYAPVMLPLVVGLRPDDFAAGHKATEHLIYSLGVGKPCDAIKRPYDGVEDAINEDMLSQEKILISIILSTTVLFVIFSVVTAINIASPMIKLSDIVKNTKKGEYDSIPLLEGGCKEVQGVYNTFAKLNKIVRISNTSFFSGKLEMAHHFVSDALVLYRKINDRKAIGVTCNNLANTLFAIQYEHIDQMKCCDLAKPCHVKQALALYDEAMGHSQQDFDEAEGDLKVNYAIQLADRLFNRGLYFLFIDGYDCAPSDSRERGYNDITFSRNLHDDIRDYMLENKQLFAKASPYFSRLLRRINCLAAFYDDVGLRDIWDAGALLDEANQLVGAATEASSRGNFCPLFQEVNRSGRQQQVESLEILLALNCADNHLAAMTGMRMLVEDAYLMESAFVRAAEALLRLMKEGDGDISFSRRSIECTRDDLRAMVKSCKKESLEISKNAVFVLEICPSQWETSNNGNDGGEMLDELELNNQCLWLYDNFLQEDDQIGIFANTMNDTQSVEIGSKGENEGRQRAFLDDATSFNGSRHSSDEESPSGLPQAKACLQTGLEMLIKSSVSLQSDSYIVWVTDGCGRHEDHEMISLRDQIEQLNQERSYQINVLIIALHHNCNYNTYNCSLENQDEHEWRNAQEILLGEIGSVSKNSIYLNANSEDELISAFQWVSRIVSNNRMTSEFISFLTMEKF